MENFEKAVISWERLGEVYYRRYSLTKTKEINYNIDYSLCHIAVSRNGGLMAFIKKSKHFIMDVTNPLKDSIRIFYQDGSVVRPIKFSDNNNIIVLFDFTDDENLILIMSDWKIYKFDIFTCSSKFKIAGSIDGNGKIIDARLFCNGFVCITNNGDFYIVEDLKEPNAKKFFSGKEVQDKYIPNDYCFISSEYTKSKRIELIFPHPKNGVINVIDKGEVKYCNNNSFINFTKNTVILDNPPSEYLGKILKINISPTGQYISMFNDVGDLFVFPASLDHEEQPREISKTKLSFAEGTYQIMWCADDCVILVNKGTIFMIGPQNKLLKLDIIKTYNISQHLNLHCISEVDGIRIFHNNNVEFLQKIHDELYLSTFPLSLDSSKKLLEAFKFAEEKRPNCDEEIRKIRQDLPDAVNKLLNAATTQWDISNQLYLVKAAQHGKTFLVKDEFNFNNFVEVCKNLRILNNMRTFDPPRLITYDQYKKLESKQLINRLIKTQNFFLANEISIYQNLKIRKVYQKWAIAKIKNLPSGLIPAEEIGFYNEIQNKLSDCQGISYIKLAKKAFKYRKEEIGIKFLENEKSILTKIPQYIELKKWDKALELAFESYDSNIIYTVIDKIIIHESVEIFKQIISKYKKAEPVLLEYLKNNDPGLLKEFLEMKKNWEGLFFYYIDNYFQATDIKLKRECLGEARKCLKNFESSKDRDRDPNFDVKFYRIYLEDVEKCFLFKRDIIKEDIFRQAESSSIDISTFDVYKLAIKAKNIGVVETKNRQSFEISNRKVSLLRLRTYAEVSDFDAINSLSINLKNFNLLPLHLAELFIDYKLYDKAAEYIKKITEEDYFDYKIAMLKYIEKYPEALEIIILNRNCERKNEYVQDILMKAPDLKFKVDELCVKYKVALN